MYKLVVVGGKLRGQEYVLKEGENVLGRDGSCDIHFPVQGVSKNHMCVTVTEDVCYVKDLKSSNGTFLNGKLINQATAQDKDKIALPDSILQVVYVKEKKKIIKKKVSLDDMEDQERFFEGGVPPQPLPRKLLWLFKYRFMRIIHGINEEYEFRVLFGILLTVFCIVVITLTIFPVLQGSKRVLLVEIGKRGAHFAEEIARINNKALERMDLDKIDTKFLDQEDGVQSYRLFDLEGRIVRPMERLNEYIEDTFSIQIKDYFMTKKGRMEKTKVVALPSGIIGIGKTVMSYSTRTGRREPVGIVAIKFSPKSLRAEAVNSSKAFMEAFITSVLVAIVFFGMVYFLILRHVEELNFQLEDALRGGRKELDSEYLMHEFKPLRNSLNALLQRIRELSTEGDEAEFVEEESDEPYLQTLQELMAGSGSATMVLDSQKNIVKMNIECEDLTGIRESTAEGLNIMDVSREKGFAATILDLCDRSAEEEGRNQIGDYELGGHQYNIHVVTLMGKDSFPKGFYISYLKEE